MLVPHSTHSNSDTSVINQQWRSIGFVQLFRVLFLNITTATVDDRKLYTISTTTDAATVHTMLIAYRCDHVQRHRVSTTRNWLTMKPSCSRTMAMHKLDVKWVACHPCTHLSIANCLVVVVVVVLYANGTRRRRRNTTHERNKNRKIRLAKIFPFPLSSFFLSSFLYMCVLYG